MLILTDLVLVDALLIRHRLSRGDDVNDLACRLAAIDENNQHQQQATCHPDSQVLLPFVRKVVILGDDMIGVREHIPRHLERDPMVPLIALRFRRVPGESRVHAFTIVYSFVNHSHQAIARNAAAARWGKKQ